MKVSIVGSYFLLIIHVTYKEVGRLDGNETNGKSEATGVTKKQLPHSCVHPGRQSWEVADCDAIEQAIAILKRSLCQWQWLVRWLEVIGLGVFRPP